MTKKNISLALCTYNGEQYLPEYLNSLSEQRYTPYELVICDDVSDDSTVSIAKSFAESSLFPVRLIENENRLGVLANYSKAISLCGGDYVALGDQDDIWLPNKLELTMQSMEDAEGKYGSNTPLLVHTDLKVINADGQEIAPSFNKLRKFRLVKKTSLKALLVQNIVTGCTVLINRPLINVATPVPGSAVMHDWWLALVASARGKIIYEPRPTVLYRRHGKNVVKLDSLFSRSSLERLVDGKEIDITIADIIKQIITLRERFGMFSESEFVYLDRFIEAACTNGYLAALEALRFGIGKAGLLRNAAFIMYLTKGDYLKYLK